MIATAAFGQEEPKEYKNEFGLDATGFIRSVLNINFDPTFQMPYTPTYFLSYRRKFKPGNIRFAIGGAYGREDVLSMLSNDTSTFQRNFSAIDVRLGWEFTTELSKRWQAYYGLDLRATFTHNYNELIFSSGGYANGRESRNEILGLAPLLGFRFRITDRISLLAEGSFSLNWAKTDRRDFFTPLSESSPELPDTQLPTARSTYTLFAQPLSIFFVFDI
ncbi:MAG: hypothetical protein EA392_13115 [Cryomorphaceae bacterium]|nr:MAG: hypothetical protein EA392_13115 [Cryomorphaceae bacterium]